MPIAETIEAIKAVKGEIWLGEHILLTAGRSPSLSTATGGWLQIGGERKEGRQCPSTQGQLPKLPHRRRAGEARRQRSQAAGATTRPHWCGSSRPNRPRIARQSTWLTGAQQLVALPLARAS